MAHIKKKPETLASIVLKYQELLRLPQSSGSINLKKHYFKVFALIRPTISSSTYQVKFEYQGGRIPQVWVCGLLSKGTSSSEIPHKFSVDEKKNQVHICLFRTKYSEFDRQSSLSKNIIPWTCEWLHFYELYLITGNWYGNGEPPNGKKRKTEN